MPVKAILDQVHSLAAAEALAQDRARFTAALGDAFPASLEVETLDASDALLRGTLAEIDALATRVMRLRLEHALADEPALPAPTQRVFAQTITGYVRQLALLEERALDVAPRGGARDPAQAARRVVEAARATLALRAALRDDVLGVARASAAGSIAEVDRRARDRTRPDDERRRWSAIRRDLEALAAEPTRLETAPLAARLAALPAQLDEPDPGPETSFADFLELD